jgi:hypothetical protein
MQHADPPVGTTRGTASDHLPAAPFAPLVSAHRIAAERTLPLAHTAQRDPAREVALERDEREQRQRDPEQREDERPKIEWVDVVGDVVRGQDEREDRRVPNDGDSDGEVPRPAPA